MGNIWLVSLSDELGKGSPEQSLSCGNDFYISSPTYLVAAGGKNKISPLIETVRGFMEKERKCLNWKETENVS